MHKSTHKWIHRLHILLRIARKYFFSSLGTLNRVLQAQENYCIKKGYHHATVAKNFDDTNNTDEWQKEVYLFAADQMKKHHYKTVIDVGCGSAYKLLRYLGEYRTTGIELEDTYQWLQKNYPGKNWLQMESIHPHELETDLVICSDVLEHVPDPDKLVQFLLAIAFKHVIISSPERDEVAGKKDYGPPANTSHYREWNREEFGRYISRHFEILEHHVFSGRSASQVILCRR